MVSSMVNTRALDRSVRRMSKLYSIHGEKPTLTSSLGPQDVLLFEINGFNGNEFRCARVWPHYICNQCGKRGIDLFRRFICLFRPVTGFRFNLIGKLLENFCAGNDERSVNSFASRFCMTMWGPRMTVTTIQNWILHQTRKQQARRLFFYAVFSFVINLVMQNTQQNNVCSYETYEFLVWKFAFVIREDEIITIIDN